MRLVCPCCGGVFSLEAAENDASVRQFNAVLCRLPHQVQHHAARYLGLFRKGDRGLAWQRALRLITELQALVAPGTVQVDGGETRPAPAQLWAEAMEETLESGVRELKNHNYLRKVVWARVRDLAAKQERNKDSARKHRAANDEPEDPASEREREAVKEMLKGFATKGGKK